MCEFRLLSNPAHSIYEGYNFLKVLNTIFFDK